MRNCCCIQWVLASDTSGPVKCQSLLEAGASIISLTSWSRTGDLSTIIVSSCSSQILKVNVCFRGFESKSLQQRGVLGLLHDTKVTFFYISSQKRTPQAATIADNRSCVAASCHIEIVRPQLTIRTRASRNCFLDSGLCKNSPHILRTPPNTRV